LRSTIVAAAAVAGFAVAEEPADGPAWTGRAYPQDVIAARQELMTQIEQLMRPIDTFASGESGDAAPLRAAASSVAAMLAAVPHLFPPTTNLYDPAAEMPVTLALPAVWTDFRTFYELAAASHGAATRLAAATEPAGLRGAAQGLRASCDACHALYLRPYVPSGVSSEDLEFDFESVLPRN
jgi:cytochrome c556